MNFLDKIKKKWVGIILFLIIISGIFLRTYNLESWLFFQSDQARDLNLVNRAVNNGPGWLPLLGPKAGGTYLRLGPIFYYMEYVSVLIFGTNSPAIVVYPDLFFSILSLPLLFFFLREFFSKKYSLMLVAGYAFCFFEIQYARFAWNPNSLPFFNLLFFYAILKFFQTTKEKMKKWWVVLIGISYVIASQLHFVSLLSLPIVLFMVFLIRKIFFKDKHEKWLKYLAIILLICIIFYIPVILSDFQSHGNNTLNFLKSFGKKGSNSSDIFGLLTKDIFVFSKYFLVILAGVVDASKNAIYIFASTFFLFFLAGIFLLKRETITERRFFLAVVFIWFFSYFVTYFPLGSTLQPRHFLVILPIPFICLGFLIYSLEYLLKFKYVSSIATIILFVPIVANVYSVRVWFSEIINSQKEISSYRKSPLLKSVGGESWWHLKKTAEFMHNDCDKKKIAIVPPKQSYRSLYDYAMQNVGEKREYSIKWNSVENDRDVCFYLIRFTKNDIADKFNSQIEELVSAQFGDVAISRFDFVDKSFVGELKKPFRKNKRSELIVADASVDSESNDSSKQDFEASINGENSTEEQGDISDKDVVLMVEPESDDIAIDAELDGGASDTSDSGYSSAEAKSLSALVENVGRKNRIFWKDLFGNDNK